MKNKKYRRIKKIGEKIWLGASTSIVTGMLLVGSNTVYADTSDYSPGNYTENPAKTGMHMMHSWNSTAKAGLLAVQLGLDKNKIKQEIKSGKTVKQVLQEHGIVPGQIQQALKSKKPAPRIKKSDGWK